MSQNRLKIRAEALDLELSGEADYVIEAYDAIREVVMKCYEETLDDSEVSRDQTSRSDVRNKSDQKKTEPLFQVDSAAQHVAAGRELTEYHLQFVVCTELYHRIAALPREGFKASIFGDVIDSNAITKIYLHENAVSSLKDQIEFGKTLWRQLTTAGKAAIHGDSS